MAATVRLESVRQSNEWDPLSRRLLNLVIHKFLYPVNTKASSVLVNQLKLIKPSPLDTWNVFAFGRPKPMWNNYHQLVTLFQLRNYFTCSVFLLNGSINKQIRDNTREAILVPLNCLVLCFFNRFIIIPKSFSLNHFIISLIRP